jgi:hypothetical protein
MVQPSTTASDVPYVMYFRGSYSLHAAFWHNNFGYRLSHGCVNLAPLDARWVFMWASPSWAGSGLRRAGAMVVAWHGRDPWQRAGVGWT